MTERVFVALDLETTGLNPDRDQIIEIGAVKISNNLIVERFTTLVNPQRAIPLRIQQLTGIRNEEVAEAPDLESVLPELVAFVSADVTAVVAHNASFDIGFLKKAGVNFKRPALDTFELATILLPGMASYSLGELCRALEITLTDAHRALDDAEADAQLFLHLLGRMRSLPLETVELIVESAGKVEWSPRLLFEDVLRSSRSTLQPAGKGRQPDLGPVSGAPENAVHSGTGSPPTVRISQDFLAAYFEPQGPLQRQLGAAYESRSGQIDMAKSVLHGLNAGDHQMIEAGTGVGKSLAYLLPAALWSSANDQRVVIATNTIALQDQLIEKDIPQVKALLDAENAGTFSVALLKGRQNYLCLRRLHMWRQNHQLTQLEVVVLAKILVWLPSTRTGDVNELFLRSPAEKVIWRQVCSDAATCGHDRCGQGHPNTDYYLLAHRRAECANLLVINHALLIADLATGGRVLPAYSHLIIDESHRLEDATTEQLTFLVDWAAIQQLLKALSSKGFTLRNVKLIADRAGARAIQSMVAEIAGQAQSVNEELKRFAAALSQFSLNHVSTEQDSNYSQRLRLDNRVRSQPMWSEIEIEWDIASDSLRSLTASLSTLIGQMETAHWQEREPEATVLAEVRDLHDRLAEYLKQIDKIILQPNPDMTRNAIAWMELNQRSNSKRNGSTVGLALAPLHVGGFLERELVHAKRTLICTGATLRTGSGFGYIRERLGLWDVTASTVPSPFDYEQSTLLYMPDNMPFPNHNQYQQAVEEAILEAVGACGGRTLVLFTSYTHLRTTADAIRSPLDRQGITVLQHGSSSRNRLLREFRQTDNSVLLGTRTFWEGIDLPGDQLRCLMIVRLPFAVPSDPMVAARSAEFDDPFNDFTVPDAIIRFRQGFGRLIRRGSDRGVVILLDSRLWRKQYGRAFLESLPTCTERTAPLANLGQEIKSWLEPTEST